MLRTYISNTLYPQTSACFTGAGFRCRPDKGRRISLPSGIRCERSGKQNCELCLCILQQHGFGSVVLVMSDFESVRAHLTAKRAWAGAGIQIYDAHAPLAGILRPALLVDYTGGPPLDVAHGLPAVPLPPAPSPVAALS